MMMRSVLYKDQVAIGVGHKSKTSMTSSGGADKCRRVVSLPTRTRNWNLFSLVRPK